MAYTWTELMDAIKVRGMVPTNQNTFTDARLLAIANNEMRTKILPIIDKVREGYFSYDIDTAINVSGHYPIHTRAVGGKLLNLAAVNDSSRRDLTRYFEEDISDYMTARGDDGFYVKGNQFYLIPSNLSGASTIRQTIMLRPGEIISTDDAAQITAIDTVTGVITFTRVPSTWNTSNIFDMVKETPHFDTLSIDLGITAIVTGPNGTMTFNAAGINSRLEVGDWISKAGQTPVIQIPVELSPLLAQHAGNACLRARNDEVGLKNGEKEAEALEKSILALITPRVQSEAKKIVNRTGMLRRDG